MKSQPYRGRLSSAEIAEGMNVARQNATRLAKDARLLFENERYASALALTILSIEESGKVSVLRGIAVASTDKELTAKWREYRSHTSKNSYWLLADMFGKGARRLEDFLPLFDPAAKHPQMLDELKQLSLYTDSFRKGHWTVPDKTASKALVEALLPVAEIYSQTRDVTSEEIDLWIHYMKPVWNTQGDEREKALIEWDDEMRRRGLKTTAVSMETFIKSGFPDQSRKAT